MPSVSESQRRYLYMKKGPAWMRQHGFDNEGPLPFHKKRRHPSGQLAKYLKRHG